MALQPLTWSAGVVLVLLASWLVQLEVHRRGARPRRVRELARTAHVLDGDDASYLVHLYRSFNATLPRSYYNLLVHRWNTEDQRLGTIFERVVQAANSVHGGCGDYVISNDFFSFRASGIAQFSPAGAFHHDCDFWKLDADDGFNLWILLQNEGLDTTFDIIEHERNAKLYANYTGERPLYMHSQQMDTSYRIVGVRRPLLASGHDELLNWQVALELLAGVFYKLFFAWRRPGAGAFATVAPAVTNVRLEVGQALVLREQELHRTDLRRELASGDFRLAVGFKMLRRNATVTQFYANCPAQRDRMEMPALWEKVGKPIEDVYISSPPHGRRIQTLDRKARFALVITSNTWSLVCLAGLAAVLGPLFLKRMSQLRATALTFACASALLLLVVAVQWSWLLEVGILDKSGRRISSLKAPR